MHETKYFGARDLSGVKVSAPNDSWDSKRAEKRKSSKSINRSNNQYKFQKPPPQSGPPRPSDAISIEPNGIPNRPNRKTQKIRVSVFRHFFGLQASYRAETLTPDRSRAPRRFKKSKNSSNRSIRSRDRPIDRIDGRSPCFQNSKKLSNRSDRQLSRIIGLEGTRVGFPTYYRWGSRRVQNGVFGAFSGRF